MTTDELIAEAAKAIAEFAAYDGQKDAYHLAKVLFTLFEQGREVPTRRTVGTYGGAVPPDAEERDRVRELLSEPSEAAKEHLRIWRYLNES